VEVNWCSYLEDKCLLRTGGRDDVAVGAATAVTLIYGGGGLELS
jgi:hypothetical protein